MLSTGISAGARDIANYLLAGHTRVIGAFRAEFDGTITCIIPHGLAVSACASGQIRPAATAMHGKAPLELVLVITIINLIVGRLETQDIRRSAGRTFGPGIIRRTDHETNSQNQYDQTTYFFHSSIPPFL